MKSVKLFERYNREEEIRDKLIKQLDDNFIEEFYSDNYGMSVEDILENYPHSIWGAIDDNKYIEDCIAEEMFSNEIEHFNEYEFIEYIKNNINNNIEQKVINKYKEITDYEEHNIEYDETMLDNFSVGDFVTIIEKSYEEDNFRDYTVRKRYEGESAESIFNDMYGKKYIKGLGYNDLYKMYGNYIIRSVIEKSFIDETSYLDKVDTLKNDIEYSLEIQRKLIEKNITNSLLLFEIFDDYNENSSIGDEYDFQKAYIEGYVKKYKADIDDIDDEDISDLKNKAIKILHDRFGLDIEIEKEYREFTRLIDMDKYNL